MLTFLDMSRHVHLFSNPVHHASALLKELGEIYKMEVARLRNAGTAATGGERGARQVRFRLLACNSIMMAFLSGDLAVRMQAAHAAGSLKSLALLMPTELSPFERSLNRQHAMVDREGFVGSIFSLPSVVDLLALRSGSFLGLSVAVATAVSDAAASKATAELAEKVRETYARRFPPQRRSKTLDVKQLASTSIGHSMSAVHSPSIAPSAADGIAPQATLGRRSSMWHSPDRFKGPALTALEVIHDFIIYLALRFALCTVDGHTVTFLRLQRQLRYNFLEIEHGVHEANGSLVALEHTDPTFEAFEEMRDGLLALARRLDALGDNARDAGNVRGAILMETRAVYLLLARLLRSARRECVREGAMEDFANLSHWVCYIESPTDMHSDRKLSLLHPFLSSVLSEFVLSRPLPSKGAPDFLRMEGATHPVPFEHLPTALIAMSPPLRRRVSLLRRDLKERRNIFLELNRKRPDSVEVAPADAEFFGIFVLLDILAEYVVAGQLGERPPASRQALARFEASFEVHFSPEALGFQQAPPATAACSAGSAGGGPAKENSAMAESVRFEMEFAYIQVTALASALDRLLLATACDRIGIELSRVVSLRHRALAARSAKAGLERQRGDLHAKKVDSVLHAVNQLKACGTYVNMDLRGADEGQRAFVFLEKDINTCVERLMLSLAAWGTDIVKDREVLTDGLQWFLASRAQTLTRQLASQRGRLQTASGGAAGSSPGPGMSRTPTPVMGGKPPSPAATSKRSRQAIVKERVAEGGCHITFEVDRLHRIIRDLNVVARELEHRLSSEIWEKVRESVASITNQVGLERGRFREGHELQSEAISQQMRSIREHVAEQVATLAAKNFATQERAFQPRPRDWGNYAEDPLSEEFPSVPSAMSAGMTGKVFEVAKRDNVQLLKRHLQELIDHNLKARIFHNFKVQAMRQKFEDQMRALQMTLVSNRELLDRIGSASERERSTAGELTSTARNNALVGLRIEDATAHLEASTEHRVRLQNWRKSKARQLGHIDKKVREHQRTGTVDVEGMLQEIREKTELVRELRAERRREDDEVAEAASSGATKVANAMTKLRQKQEKKEEARKNLVRLRADAERGGLPLEERLKIWRTRCSEAKHHLEALMEDNAKLKEVHQALEETAARHH